MQFVAKHHRMIELTDARGKAQEWFALECAYLESGIRYAKEHGMKRILFAASEQRERANKVTIDVLSRFTQLEGIIWHPPVKKGTDVSALHAHTGLTYLSAVDPHLRIDLAAFQKLELLVFEDSANVTGFEKAGRALRSVKVMHLSRDLAFLAPLEGLVELDVHRSSIASLDGIEQLKNLKKLELVYCHKLTDLTPAAKLKKLEVFRFERCPGLSDVSVLGRFDALKTLWLMAKKITSCKFIASMKSIEFASLNAEISDNDLSPLLASKTLEEVWFAPFRKSYRPHLSPDELNEALGAR